MDLDEIFNNSFEKKVIDANLVSQRIKECRDLVIDSVGKENEWKEGDRIAFSDIGGIYMKVEDVEYVVITPEMIIGKL